MLTNYTCRETSLMITVPSLLMVGGSISKLVADLALLSCSKLGRTASTAKNDAEDSSICSLSRFCSMQALAPSGPISLRSRGNFTHEVKD